MTREDFKKFLDDKNLKPSRVAKSIGVSASMISQWQSNTYKGDNQSLEKKLESFKNNYDFKQSAKTSAFELKETTDLQGAFFVMEEAIVDNEMAILYGAAGTGKTTTIKEFAESRSDTRLLELVPGISTKKFLELICEKINISPEVGVDTNILNIAKELGRGDIAIIIDEAEHLTVRSLEAIRRVWDFTPFALILVGTPVLIKNLKGNSGELLQLYSRPSGKYEFKGLRANEFELFFGDFGKEVKKYTTHMRRAVSLYRKATRFALMNNEKLDVKHIKLASTMVFLD
ncbi:AAA family ATPase [Sulfurimonas sp.]|uniref:AAA family ATPase n=1 Tax=Sulfurimonas sp. TaxID=2022749 RepID=UPI002B4728B4|nr:AAA family ATPase [Sulfurimonas sp.]